MDINSLTIIDQSWWLVFFPSLTIIDPEFPELPEPSMFACPVGLWTEALWTSHRSSLTLWMRNSCVENPSMVGIAYNISYISNIKYQIDSYNFIEIHRAIFFCTPDLSLHFWLFCSCVVHEHVHEPTLPRLVMAQWTMGLKWVMIHQTMLLGGKAPIANIKSTIHTWIRAQVGILRGIQILRPRFWGDTLLKPLSALWSILFLFIRRACLLRPAAVRPRNRGSCESFQLVSRGRNVWPAFVQWLCLEHLCTSLPSQCSGAVWISPC